ncbi:sulfurtransferase [Corynebacterium aquilae]|uniref:Rhodanese domain-containing protein n=1 Tax=Corynebacterium aquilae DSM 44791 TaxID=1431546 RepID=A0A1L7CG00_9CORY|nr:sulfurtransferase [Corynebacterium aquilae]APT84703.1 hypothetical protein CAQU_06055 [Corynebacterium aquilae DSM 44791]
MNSACLSLPTPVVDVEWLLAHRDDPRVVVLCASMGNPAKSLARGIPGAVLADIEGPFSQAGAEFPHTVPDDVQAPFEACGVSDDSLVVVYDRHGMMCAPRVWWLARVAGLRSVAVLDGGLPAWEAAGGQVVEISSPPVAMGSITAASRPELLVGAREVAQWSRDGGRRIVDARSAQRFAGTAPEPRPGMKAGHIPSSVSLPFESLLTEDKKLLSPERLRALIGDVVGPGPVVTSCGSGVTACVDALAMMYAGHEDVVVYDGSWSQWGSEKENFPFER